MILYILFLKMKKTIFLICLTLFLSSCSLFHQKISPYPNGVVFPLEKDKEIIYEGEIVDLIQREESFLYFSTTDGIIYKIDGERSEIIWKFKSQKEAESPPSIGLENIYFYDKTSTLYCLNKEGKLCWKKTFEEKITSEIKEIGEIIFIGTEKGNFFALTTASGKEIWRFKAGGAIRSNPISSDNMIIFGCDDQYIYFLSKSGTLLNKYEAGGVVGSTLLVDGNLLYFGTEGHNFYCFDLKKWKEKWEVKSGGKIITSPVIDNKRLFFLSWSGVLYCLNKKNGSILWWKSIPYRSYYRFEIVQDKIVVSSLSSFLVCFDSETGEKMGQFDALLEVSSNPLWFYPFLLINVYEKNENMGKLLFLRKKVKLSLILSKKSPQKTDEEIVFTASAKGLFREKYEFYLEKEGKKQIVQEMSEKKSWTWFPEKAGKYIIGCISVDEREKVEAKISFEIIEEEK